MRVKLSFGKRLPSAISLALFCLATAVNAESLVKHEDIQKAVIRYMTLQQTGLRNLQVTLTSLDRQLNLPACGNPLEVQLPPGAKTAGHTSVSVACAAPQAWKIQVAVHVDGEVEVLVADQSIIRGTQIHSQQVKKMSKNYSQLHYGFYTSFQNVEGMEARRDIKPGQVLTPGLVNPRKLVTRGQHVTIIAQRGNLVLRLKGKALMDGREGQTIRIQNMSTNKLLYGDVIGPSLVRVNI